MVHRQNFRYARFGRKKKQDEVPAPNLSNYQKRLEISNKNIDLGRLTTEIEKFLKKSDDPFDFATYTIHVPGKETQSLQD